ncbi:hypothetical protein Bca101_023270 [Brassica carinata]
MSDSFFSRDSQFVPFIDFYKQWSKTVTEICLPRLRESLSTADSNISAANVRHVLNSLEWYYEQLNHYAETEPNTVPYLLFPSWPDSLELQTLFLGDLHPSLLTFLARSFILRAVPESSSPEMAARTEGLVNRIKWIEGDIEAEIKRLLEDMKKAQILFMARFSDTWALSNHAQEEEQRIIETVAKVAMEDGEAKKAKTDGEAKKDAMKDIFVSANILRRNVIRRIVVAIAKDYNLAALFLESVCKFFAGFKDQAEGFKKSLASSPFMAQLPTTDKDQVHQPPGQSATHNGLKMVPANDRTLWMGNIKDGMDEKYIVDSFGDESVGIVSVKITKEKYCAFIEFDSWSAANMALKKYMYQQLPGGFGFYQLNWSNKRLQYTVYVYGLSSTVTAESLKTFFATYYPSVQDARFEVMGSSRRGRVTFADINDSVKSLREMDGYLFDSSPMAIRDS